MINYAKGINQFPNNAYVHKIRIDNLPNPIYVAVSSGEKKTSDAKLNSAQCGWWLEMF